VKTKTRSETFAENEKRTMSDQSNMTKILKARIIEIGHDTALPAHTRARQNPATTRPACSLTVNGLKEHEWVQAVRDTGAVRLRHILAMQGSPHSAHKTGVDLNLHTQAKPAKKRVKAIARQRADYG
jgi:5,10-methylenetetrahydrofolate reductase